MIRRSLIIPVVLAALPVAAGAWVLRPIFVERAAEVPAAVKTASAGSMAAKLPDLEALKPRESPATAKAGFDVARIEKGGWSVFAGTAPANSTVTVTADGVPIGTAKADHNGEWTLLTYHKFRDNIPVLGLETHFGPAPGTKELVARAPVSKDAANASTSAPGPAAARASGGPHEASATGGESGRILREFEDLVASARNAQPAAAPRSTAAATPTASVPLPVQFIFRKAEVTQDGRKALALLHEYLMLKRPESVQLTGHADERGSEAFNMELSRLRLEAVASYLRDNGYTGRLELIPKGSSDPYRGVDRTIIDREELYQLDRRVELVIDSRSPPARAADGRRTPEPGGLGRN